MKKIIIICASEEEEEIGNIVKEVGNRIKYGQFDIYGSYDNRIYFQGKVVGSVTITEHIDPDMSISDSE